MCSIVCSTLDIKNLLNLEITPVSINAQTKYMKIKIASYLVVINSLSASTSIYVHT